MNKVIIDGRLVRDPDMRTTASGTEVCNFCVAVDRRFKKDGQTETDFIECTAWGKQAAFVDKYFRKGRAIVVEGRMESSKWSDKDGKNRVSWAITCDNIEFAFEKKDDSAPSYSSVPASSSSDGRSDFTEITEEDGDLPF